MIAVPRLVDHRHGELAVVTIHRHVVAIREFGRYSATSPAEPSIVIESPSAGVKVSANGETAKVPWPLHVFLPGYGHVDQCQRPDVGRIYARTRAGHHVTGLQVIHEAGQGHRGTVRRVHGVQHRVGRLRPKSSNGYSVIGLDDRGPVAHSPRRRRPRTPRHAEGRQRSITPDVYFGTRFGGQRVGTRGHGYQVTGPSAVSAKNAP